MTTYLLDTNACIALINGTQPEIRRRFAEAVAAGDTLLLSSIVTFELWYGVAKSQRAAANAERLETFLAGPVEWVAFDEEAARAAGDIRGALERAGTPIGAYDVLVAGHARSCGAVVVTSNTREFERVSAVRWEDWARSVA